MNKTELVNAIAEKAQLTKVQAKAALEATMEAIGEDGTIQITLEEKDNFVLWKIKDSGCGIPDSIANKIFEPFVSGKNNGTGLGMAIVKSFVEKHEGTISVKSTVGEGTEMIISLPKI